MAIHFFNISDISLDDLLQRIVIWFDEKDYKVDFDESPNGYTIQAKKIGKLRTMLGTNSVFIIELEYTKIEDEIKIESKIGEVQSNLTGAGVTGLFTGGVTWITGAAGAAWALKIERDLVVYLQIEIGLKKIKTIEPSESNEVVGEEQVLIKNYNPATPEKYAEAKVQGFKTKIIKAFNNGILTEEEKNIKINGLKPKLMEYEIEFLLEAKTKKLENALQDEIITQEEFDSKVINFEAKIRKEVELKYQEQEKKQEQNIIKAESDSESFTDIELQMNEIIIEEKNMEVVSSQKPSIEMFKDKASKMKDLFKEKVSSMTSKESETSLESDDEEKGSFLSKLGKTIGKAAVSSAKSVTKYAKERGENRSEERDQFIALLKKNFQNHYVYNLPDKNKLTSDNFNLINVNTGECKYKFVERDKSAALSVMRLTKFNSLTAFNSVVSDMNDQQIFQIEGKNGIKPDVLVYDNDNNQQGKICFNKLNFDSRYYGADNELLCNVNFMKAKETERKTFQYLGAYYVLQDDKRIGQISQLNTETYKLLTEHFEKRSTYLRFSLSGAITFYCVLSFNDDVDVVVKNLMFAHGLTMLRGFC